MGRMRRASIVWLCIVGLAFAATGCSKRALRYDDDVDLAGMRAAFDCGKGPTAGDRAEACRIVGDFANGVPFEAFPAKGLETWRGRKVCSDAIDKPDAMDLGMVYLHPGIGKAIFPDDVKTEPARDVAHGGLFIPGSASFKNPVMRLGYEEMIAAAREGRAPAFTMVPPEERSFLQLVWDNGQKTPNATSEYYRLVRSKGKSILHNPMTTEDGHGASAMHFVRANGPRMIVVQPGGHGAPPCVSELWKTYVEP
jgi:hypothetical protein